MRYFFLCWVTACAVMSAMAAAEQPNILVIVSEDNGPELGCYGEPAVQTPVLDRLAAEGVRFEHAFVPQAGCSQSRAAYLTGLYPHQNGQIGLATWNFALFREDTPNMVRSLKDAGYRTGLIGKLHVNPESAFPFDFWEIHSSNFARKDLDGYADAAKRFINESDAPFFLSVNYPDAHREFLPQVDGRPATLIDPDNIKPLRYIGLDTPDLRRDTALYYDCMARLDGLVGDLLAVLEQSGKAGNTLVVYFGDHGADLLRGKRTSYEGGFRIPLIVRWPGHMQAGQVREEMVSTLDLMPTFLQASDAAPVPNLAGMPLQPLLEDAKTEWRKYLFAEYHLHSNHNYYPQRSLRTERYKLIQNVLPNEVNPGYDYTLDKYYGPVERKAISDAPGPIPQAYAEMRQPPAFELYDLKADPHEYKNLAGDPEYQAVLEELKTQLQTWREDTHDPFLNLEHVRRLQAEIEATKKDGEYTKPKKPWGYLEYMKP